MRGIEITVDGGGAMDNGGAMSGRMAGHPRQSREMG